ncbi:hypothetical protein [Mycoplana ramosa]|uniref:Uncharacterized protein n=1 Tax=Mycoplana ramosa TaxID=40837 RepID=A0ABW3Z217_MYCRA
MKLWLILYVGQQIGGTWGPLPYGLNECERRAAEGNAISEQARGRPELIGKMKRNGISAPLQDWKFVCEFRSERPALGGQP